MLFKCYLVRLITLYALYTSYICSFSCLWTIYTNFKSWGFSPYILELLWKVNELHSSIDGEVASHWTIANCLDEENHQDDGVQDGQLRQRDQPHRRQGRGQLRLRIRLVDFSVSKNVLTTPPKKFWTKRVIFLSIIMNWTQNEKKS